MRGLDQHALGLLPRLKAAIEAFGSGAGMAQPGRRALAQFLSALADDGDGLPGVFPGPVRDGSVTSARTAGKPSRIGAVIVIDPNVYNAGCVGRTDETRELRGGDGVGCGHGRPSP
jgi:hypothetical protein